MTILNSRIKKNNNYYGKIQDKRWRRHHPQGVKVIEDGAFAYHSSLKSVTIPDSVTVIRSQTFEGRTSLESVTLLSRAELDDGLFANCPSLQTINVPSDYVDYYKKYLLEELHDKIVELNR